MRWRGRERSDNVDDRRGVPGSAMVLGGGGLGFLLLAVIAVLLGVDPRALLQVAPNIPQAAQNGGPAAGGAVDDDTREFIQVVLRDTETIWAQLFDQHVEGTRYVPPRLVIFSGATQTGCGPASAAVGPFYCPADQQVYMDPAFFDELSVRHRAPGDFAQAYVISHEVAHHVQHLLGFDQMVQRARRSGNVVEGNRASVRLELQADFLAGVWAHHAHREFEILEPGDVEEAIRAANQIGDDRLQLESAGYVIPERFTHGTSAQRTRWFQRGFATGDLLECQQLFELDYSEL